MAAPVPGFVVSTEKRSGKRLAVFANRWVEREQGRIGFWADGIDVSSDGWIEIFPAKPTIYKQTLFGGKWKPHRQFYEGATLETKLRGTGAKDLTLFWAEHCIN